MTDVTCVCLDGHFNERGELWLRFLIYYYIIFQIQPSKLTHRPMQHYMHSQTTSVPNHHTTLFDEIPRSMRRVGRLVEWFEVELGSERQAQREGLGFSLGSP